MWRSKSETGALRRRNGMPHGEVASMDAVGGVCVGGADGDDHKRLELSGSIGVLKRLPVNVRSLSAQGRDRISRAHQVNSAFKMSMYALPGHNDLWVMTEAAGRH